MRAASDPLQGRPFTPSCSQLQLSGVPLFLLLLIPPYLPEHPSRLHVDTRLEDMRPTPESVPRCKVVHCPTPVGTVSLALAPYLTQEWAAS